MNDDSLTPMHPTGRQPTSKPPSLAPGASLGGYIVHEVKRGGMGEVFICSVAGETEASTLVALKTFQQRFFFDPGIRMAFAREVENWLQLQHEPFIMPAVGIETIDHRPF